MAVPVRVMVQAVPISTLVAAALGTTATELDAETCATATCAEETCAEETCAAAADELASDEVVERSGHMIAAALTPARIGPGFGQVGPVTGGLTIVTGGLTMTGGWGSGGQTPTRMLVTVPGHMMPTGTVVVGSRQTGPQRNIVPLLVLVPALAINGHMRWAGPE